MESRITETDNTIQTMKIEMNNTKSAYQKELEQKNQLIKDSQEKVATYIDMALMTVPRTITCMSF